MAVIKRVSGEDSISCRALYGHVVEIPPRAKLNFGVNKPPKLPPAKDMVEQFALLRRFVYIDCAMNFMDLTEVRECLCKVAVFWVEQATVVEQQMQAGVAGRAS